MERALVRTLKLTRPLWDIDKEIEELEFLEPTSKVFNEIERISEWNANAKRPKDVIPMSGVLLEHLTGLRSATLEKMTFADRKAANDIVAEILAGEMGIDTDGDEDSTGKS